MILANDAKTLLLKENINTDSKVAFEINAQEYKLTFEEIIDVFMMASQESQEIFYSGLESAIALGEDGIEKFFEGMGQLLLMSHLSEKFES